MFLAVALAASCQPVDDGVPPAGETVGASAPTEVRGSPASRLTEDLGAMLDGLGSTAAQWQAGTRVVEVVVELDGDAWQRATVTYLAPDADRFLVVDTTPEGTSQQRPTLATLDLPPVPGAALEQVPPWPTDALEPAALVEVSAQAREDCGVGEVTSVVYASGAPAAWNGEAWTEPPTWTATLSDGASAVIVDPVTGAAPADACSAGP